MSVENKEYLNQLKLHLDYYTEITNNLVQAIVASHQEVESSVGYFINISNDDIVEIVNNVLN